MLMRLVQCANVGGLQVLETFVFGSGEGGEAEDAASRGAHGFWDPAADGTGEADEAGGTEGFGGAQDGAEVAGVLDAGEDDHERLWCKKGVPGPIEGTGEGWAIGCGDSVVTAGGEDFRREGEDFEGVAEVEFAEKIFMALGDEDCCQCE